MPIGTFGRATGLSLKALRLYDRTGILTAAYTDLDSGYRYYGVSQIAGARQIRLMRAMDMPLALIGQVLTAPEGEAQRLIRGYQASAEARLTQVQRTTHTLLCSWNKETTMEYEVEAQEVPQAQVVSITNRVTVESVRANVVGSLSRLSEFVKGQGGESAGVPFGICYGPVTNTDDGPMEVCLPVQGSFTASGDIVVKELEAHRAATIDIAGDQCSYPAVLDAFDAAYDWISANGYVPAGPPRQTWISQIELGPMRISWPFRDKE